MRKASSMLELIIAIVVMGIAVMALPLMLSMTQKNNEFSMQQEAILAARTQIGDILTYPWDENSIANGYVLDTNSTNINFERENNTTRRVGHVQKNKRRKYSPATTYASLALGQEDANYNDIDDFNSGTIREATETNGTAIAGLDYKFDFNMTTTVSYVADTLTSPFVFEGTVHVGVATKNIKMIELTLQGQELNTFKLRAYSTNIGQSELLRRPY